RRFMSAGFSWNERNTRGHLLGLRAIALALRGRPLQEFGAGVRFPDASFAIILHRLGKRGAGKEITWLYHLYSCRRSRKADSAPGCANPSRHLHFISFFCFTRSVWHCWSAPTPSSTCVCSGSNAKFLSCL